MDTCGSETSCKNAPYGCTFASSSEVDIVKHFQWDCAFHPVPCFKCNRTVRKVNFEKHYMGYCKDNPGPPYPAPEEVPDVGTAEAIRIMFEEQHFLRECVGECRLGVESLSHAMKDVAADVAEVKVIKTKQEDLEAIVKGQGDVIQEHGKSMTLVLEKIEKMQEDMGALVKECITELKLRTGREKDLEASVKQQEELIKGLEKAVLTSAEKIDKVQNNIGTIVERVEKVGGLVKVRVLTHPLADQSRIHWYVENVSRYIEESKKGKTGWSSAKSNAFVVRGYSARLELSLARLPIISGRMHKKTTFPWEVLPDVEISLVLCRGPNDSLLQWPFRIPFTLSLIHPTDASKTKERKVTPPDHAPQEFKKPQQEENSIFLSRPLCTVDKVQNEGFIENDAVCFSLTLHE